MTTQEWESGSGQVRWQSPMDLARKRLPATGPMPADNGEAESALLERLRRGEPDAAAEFYERYAARIHRFIVLSLGGAPSAEAEDLLQETLISLADALPFFRGDSTLFTFACGIAHRKVASHLRKTARRARLIAAAPAPAAQDDSADDVEMRQALSALDADARELLILKYVNEARVSEIARILSASEHAVESRLARARRALKRHLKREP